MKTINKSKLSGDLLSAYDKIQKLKEKDSVKGLEMEQKFISILDKKNHESIVSKPIKKSTTKKATKNKTAKKTTGVAKRRTVMTVAKEIRKKDESWQDALKRAKLDMNKSTKKQVTAIDDELSKLKNLIKNDKNLKGFKGSDSDLIRDASRKALPKGKRISKKGGKNQHGTSKGGRVYYENRENRSDRYAPKYPKDKPYLKYGGDVMSLGIANADAVYSKGGKTDGDTLGDFKKRLLELGDKEFVEYKEKQLKKQDLYYAFRDRLKNVHNQKIVIKDDLPFEKGGKTQGKTLAENFNMKDTVKNVEFWKNDVIVEDKNGKVARIDLDKGERIELNAKGGEIESYNEFISREDEYLDNIWDNEDTEDFKIHKRVEQLMKKDNKWHPDYRGYVDETYYKYYTIAKKNTTYAKGGKLDLDEYYSKMVEKLGKKGAFERVLKDSQFGNYKGTPSNEFKHNRLPKTAIIGKNSVSITSYTPNTKRYLDSQTFTSPKELAEYLDKNQIFAKGGEIEYYKDGEPKLDTMQKEKMLKPLDDYGYYLKIGNIIHYYDNNKNWETSKIGYAKGGKTKRSKHSIMQDRRRVSKQSWEVAYQKRKAKMEKGGEIDLFEDYQSQPKELSEIVEKYEERYADGDMDYKDTEKFLKEVNAIGYTFDSGLDNEPYNLRPMMAKGGDVMSLGIANADAVFKKGGELYTHQEAMEFANRISKKLMAKGGEITKTGNKGSARWEMKITDDEGNTSSIYAEKKSDLLQYKKMYLANGGRLSARTQFSDYDFDKLSYDFVVFNDRVETEDGKVVGTINSKGHLVAKGDKTLKNPLVKWLQQNSYVSNEEYYKLAKGGAISSIKKNNDLSIHDSYYAKGGLTDSKYIPSYEIYEVVTKDGKVYENDYSAMQFLSGAYVSDKVVTKPEEKDGSQMTLFDKGGKIPKGAIYIKRRDIDFITVGEYEDDKEKISGKNLFNGFWIDPKKQKTLISEAIKDGRLGKSKANKMAKGGRLKVYDESYDVPIKTFNSFEKAKNWVLENHKKYDEITIEDAYLDTIVVDKTDTKDDIEFLFSDNMAKGGRTISIVNDGVKFDKSKYKAVYGDFDKDGTVNIDDANPLDSTKKNKVEQVELKDTFDKLLGVKAELDNIMYDAVDTLDKKAPKDADIYARTKTPYSILKKLVEKRMLDPEKGLTDMIGTTIAVDSQKELENVRDDIDGGLLGKVLDKDDYYKSPKAGYRAYHYIVEYKGVPVEVQLKTKNMKKLHEVSHEAYKNGTLNAKSLDSLSKTFMRADKGDAKAKAEISKLLSDKKLLASKVSKSTMAKGGEVDYRGYVTNDVVEDIVRAKGLNVQFRENSINGFEIIGQKTELNKVKSLLNKYNIKSEFKSKKGFGLHKLGVPSQIIEYAKGGKTKTKKPNSFFAVVKREQKEGESWKDAIQRVKKQKSVKK